MKRFDLIPTVTTDGLRPLAEGWERDVDDEFLREDISKCVDGDASRRLSSATELSRRLRALPEAQKIGGRSVGKDVPSLPAATALELLPRS